VTFLVTLSPCRSPEPSHHFNKWKKRVMELSDCKPRYQSECLRCGETMFLPEWSGYLDRYRIQHLWECGACGHKFKTLVSLSHYKPAFTSE
jgi:ribosomal protein S27AE